MKRTSWKSFKQLTLNLVGDKMEVPDSEAIATSVLLKHIADRYRKAFRQESVLVSEVSTQTTFV